MIQKPGSSTAATCSCNVLVQKMILCILSHGGFTVLWIHNFLLTLDPLITSLEFLIIFLGVGMDTFWNQALAQSAPLPLTRQF